MGSNVHSNRQPELTSLAAAVEELAARDLDGLPDAALAEEVVRLRRLMDGLEGQWLRRLAAVDARGAAGADQDQPALSTASWLRNRLRMGAGTATSSVRTARALFRGPLAETARALTGGELSAAHATVLASGIQDLPHHVAMEAEPGWWTRPAASTLPGCDGSSATCDWSSTRTAPATWRSGAMRGGGCGSPPPGRAWSPSTACWSRRPATPCCRRWSRWPARPAPTTAAAAASATPTPSPSWPVAPWRADGSPRPPGSGPS